MGIFTRKKKEEKPKYSNRGRFSLSFFMSIPGNFLIASLAFLSIGFMFIEGVFQREIFAVFLTGLLGGFAMFRASTNSKLWTFIHEAKHAIIIVFTGNKIKEFNVGKGEGNVSFEMYEDTLHFAPIIALAPYFFPLLSLPCLIFCIALESYNRPLCSLLLGLCLAIDITTSFGELHPYQTDFKKVFGGFFSCALYLAGVHLMWFSVCILWVVGGWRGYLFTLDVVLQLLDTLYVMLQEYFNV